MNGHAGTGSLITRPNPQGLLPESDHDYTDAGVGFWAATSGWVDKANGCTEDGNTIEFDYVYLYWRKGHWVLTATLKRNSGSGSMSEYFFVPSAGNEPEGDVYENTPETPTQMRFDYAGVAQVDYDDGSTTWNAADVDCDGTSAYALVTFYDCDFAMNCDHCSVVTIDAAGFDGPAYCTGFNSIETLGGGGLQWDVNTVAANSRVRLRQITQSNNPKTYRWELGLRATGGGVDDYRYYLDTDQYMPMCGEQASPQFVLMAEDFTPCSVVPSFIGVGAFTECNNADILCDHNLSVPAQYQFTLSGITNGSCGSCTSYNTTITLTRSPGTCLWVDSNSTPCGTNTYTGWRSRLEYNLSSGWNLRIFNGNKTLAVYGYHPNPPQREAQKIEKTGNPTSGTYTLSLDGNTTSAIDITLNGNVVETRISSDLSHDTNVIPQDKDLRDGPLYVQFTDEDEKEEVQRITVVGTSLSGSFTITFESQTTAAIAWCPEPSHIKAALEALSNVPANSIGVSANLNGCDNGAIYDITFRSGGFSGRDVDEVTLDTSGISGTITSESVATQTEGHTPNVDEMTIAASFDTGGASVSTIQNGTYGPPNPWNALGSNVMIREYVDSAVCDDWPESITMAAV